MKHFTLLQLRKSLLLLAALFLNMISPAQVHVGTGQLYAKISNACSANAIVAGDTVYLHAGTYPGDLITNLIGNATHWITIRSYKNDSITITGQWTWQRIQYVKISGLNFVDVPTSTFGTGHMMFFDYEYNCFTNIHDIIVDHCNYVNFHPAQSSGQACLKFDGADHFQVTNCRFSGTTNVNDGINMNADRNGLVSNCRFEGLGGASHFKSASKNIRYEKNLIINCAIGLWVGGSGGSQYFCPVGAPWEADSIRVYSNIIIGGTGIRLASCSNSEIINNTCFKTQTQTLRCLDENGGQFPFVNNKIYNNIFTTNDNSYYGGLRVNATGGVDYSSFSFNNNLFYDYANTSISSADFGEVPGAKVSGTIVGNPMFADTAKRNFTLLTASAGKGAGFKLANPVSDYNGNNFNTNTRSIGAVEFPGLVNIDEQEEVNNMLIYPNPSAGVFNISWLGTGNISTIQVFNVLGQIVYTDTPNNYYTTINMDNAPKGIYKAIVHSDKGSVSVRTLLVN